MYLLVNDARIANLTAACWFLMISMRTDQIHWIVTMSMELIILNVQSQDLHDRLYAHKPFAAYASQLSIRTGASGNRNENMT